MKTRIIFIVVFALVTSLVYSQDNQNFNSPETVMRYFVNNIKNGNFENVFRTSPFYYDSIIEKTNPRELINYMNTILFQLDPNLPLQYRSIIKYSLLGIYSAGLKRFIFCLLLSEEYPELANLTPININDTILDSYFSLLNIQNLQTLEFVRMDVYRSDIQFNERGKNNTIRQYIVPFGCDEKVEYTVLYKINGKYYAGGVILVRYGSSWYIDSLSGSYSNIGIGSLKQVSGIIEYINEYDIE